MAESKDDCSLEPPYSLAAIDLLAGLMGAAVKEAAEEAKPGEGDGTPQPPKFYISLLDDDEDEKEADPDGKGISLPAARTIELKVQKQRNAALDFMRDLDDNESPPSESKNAAGSRHDKGDGDGDDDGDDLLALMDSIK